MKKQDMAYLALGILFITAAVFYFLFFWLPTCAFTPIAEAPVICLGR